MQITRIRSIALALVASAMLAGGLAGTASAAAGPSGDADPGASAVLPPRDPGAWFIKANGLTATARTIPDILQVKMWNMPSNINPIYVSVLWHFTPVPSNPGAYFVENHNGGCLDVFDGISTAIGAKLTLRQCDGTLSQMWTTPFSGGKWAMKSVWSGLWATVRNPVQDGSIMTQQFAADPGDVRYFDMPFFGSL
ncbi:RICIN domain-containing protein [Streptosporangiaceae bacterium NEAU-GS5]|nr:RICIN domain-containing protein [Streptosporangiaceae bacterium NEAU-GS5]